MNRHRNDDLDDEIRSHLALAKHDRVARGESPEDAEDAARREFGNSSLVKEVTRRMWGWTFLERLAQDAKYALRQLRANPGFTAVAILSLALGIGANSAIFSIFNALLLRSLPVASPEELFIVRQQSTARTPQRFTYPMFQRLRDASAGDSGKAAKSVAAMSRIARTQAVAEGAPESEIAATQLISGEFFSLLGLAPALGRVLGPSDNLNLSGHPVAVISHGYWQRRFAGSPDVLGRAIRLNGARFTIIGVAPEGFRGIWIENPTDIWIPLMMQADIHYAQNFSSHDTANPEKPWVPQDFLDWLDLLVRTEPARASATREALNATFLHRQQEITSSLGPNTRRYYVERSLVFEPFGRGLSNLRERFTPPLTAMMALVALVLLIACANTANLLLARAEGRRREIAVRLSIGASRARVIQQLLTESLLLSATAAGLGLLLASRASDFLVRMALGVANGPTPLATQLDWRVAGFTVALSVATGLLFGLAPAFRAAKTELGVTMNTASRSVAGLSRFSPARFLVAAQVALSLLVVAGAGLFARSLNNLAHVQLGFEPEHVLTVVMNPRAAGIDSQQLSGLYAQLAERVEAVPGVRSAAISMCGLVVECRSSSDGLRIPGYELGQGESIILQYNVVGPRYFATTGTRLVEGREFDERDRFGATRPAIVNQALARKYFAERSPIGQRIIERMGRGELVSEIVGVVEDARVNRVREPAAPMAYYPFAGTQVFGSSFEVRAAGSPQTIAAEVRAAIHQAAPDVPIERMSALTQQVDRSLNQERMLSILAAAFGVLALGLACFGLYGVMSYAVTRRVSEIGLRMALGARPRSILWTVLRDGLALIVLGLVVGIPVATFASRSVGPLLYEVKPNDLVTLAGSAVVLTLVAIVAGVFPAWRASRVNPVVALRHD